MHRKDMAGTEAPEFIEREEHSKIFHLVDIRSVLFQCLLLDDMHMKDGLFEAKLYTVYLLE